MLPNPVAAISAVSWLGSILLHLVVGLVLWLGVLLSFSRPQKPSTLVELVDSSTFEQAYFIKDFQKPPQLPKGSSAAQPKVFSKMNQEVPLVQQARLLGPTFNSFSGGMNEETSLSAIDSQSRPDVDADGEFQATLRSLRSKGLSRPSSINFHIPGVELADFTVLSTQEWAYYSFFARIEDKLRPLWIWQLSRLMPQRLRLGVRRLEGITQVVLNEKGEIIGIEWVKAFGVEPIEKATLAALWEAKSFENPPIDLIQNGQVTLRFHFTVLLE